MRVVHNIANRGQALRNHIGDAWRTQVVLTNTTNQPQAFQLWGANMGFGGGGYPSVPTGVFPLRIAYNPVNNHSYAINQQSGTVTVFTDQWQAVATIQLDAANPGQGSPSSLAVDPNTGVVYVAGSLTDKLYPIALDFTVGIPINLPARPMSVAWNPVTGRLYVACLATDQLVVVDPATNTIDLTIPVGNAPVQVAIMDNGNIVVLHQADESLSVIRTDHTPLASVTGLSGVPVAFAILDNAVFVVTKSPGHIYKVSLEGFSIESSANLIGSAGTVLAIPSTNTVLVSIPAQNSLTTIGEDLSDLGTLTLPGGVSGLAVHPVLEVVMVADHLNQRILILTSSGGGSAVTVSENYKSINSDFQFNPALVRHVRLIWSGTDYYPAIQVATRTPSGRMERRSISLGAYRSPWQWNNMAEVFGMEGEIITGKTWWEIHLLPYQAITILVYHRQFRTDVLLKKITA